MMRMFLERDEWLARRCFLVYLFVLGESSFDGAKMSSLTENPNFRQLKALFDGGKKDLNLNELFNADPNRYAKHTATLETPDGEILIDYSKNLVDEAVLKELFELVIVILTKIFSIQSL